MSKSSRWMRGAALAAVGLGVMVGGGLPCAAGAQPPTTRLLGTAVGSGGESSALFGDGKEFVWVRKGSEVAPGVSLAEVRTDRVVLKVDDSGREFPMFIGRVRLADARAWNRSGAAASGVVGQPRRKSPREMSPEELRSLSEEIKAEFRRARAADTPRGSRKRRTRVSQED